MSVSGNKYITHSIFFLFGLSTEHVGYAPNLFFSSTMEQSAITLGS